MHHASLTADPMTFLNASIDSKMLPSINYPLYPSLDLGWKAQTVMH